MAHIPVDSSDAAEQRELENERAEAERAEAAAHVIECVDGWLGEDEEGRPRPCLRCRPTLMHVPCRTCGVPHQACAHQEARRRGPCCDACDHSRRARPRPDNGRRPDADGVSAAAGTSDQSVLRAWTPGRPSSHQAHRLILVDDPDLGPVAVRWRAPRELSPWTYRCTACQSYQAQPECRHTFAAGLHLAESLLGLTPLNPRTDPQTSQEEHAS